MIKWFKNRRIAIEQFRKDIELSAVAPRLHNINLNEWRYLGRTVLSFTDEDNIPSAKATLFSFCSTNDIDNRRFIIIPHQLENQWADFDYHTYVIEHASLWKIGERDLWDIVGTEPSRWLREYMFETHGITWDVNASWWSNGTVSPKSLPKNKKNSMLKLVEPPNDETNVVRVTFGKNRKEDIND